MRWILSIKDHFESIQHVALAAILALYVALYGELFHEGISKGANTAFDGLLGGSLTASALWHCCVIFIIALLVLIVLFQFFHEIIHFMHKYRLLIALGILVVCVLFEISGSSIGYWSSVLGGGTGDDGVLFGVSRPIRSDEWCVLTPFAFSQSFTGYAPFSELVRGSLTDMTMTYAAPNWSISTVFRPFLWGYLLLGSAKGLSFYWVGRLLALFLVTYECTKLIVGGNKYLSAIVAVVFSFSPITQWWFAVNGTAEIFIFGQGVVLCLDKLFSCTRKEDGRRRLVSSLLLFECLGGYLFVLYPAWQIPMFYVFAVLGVYVIAKRVRSQIREKNARSIKINIGCAIGSTVVFLTVSLIGVMGSMDMIQATMNTFYPGNRSSDGGGGFAGLWAYGLAIFGAIDPEAMYPNVCEAATFFSLFPLGVILGCIVGLLTKDKLSLALLALDVLFIIYMWIGLPHIVAVVTLLNKTIAARIKFGIGVLDVLLFARALYLLPHIANPNCYLQKCKRYLDDNLHALVISIVLSGALTAACYLTNRSSFHIVYVPILFLAVSMIAFYAIRVAAAGRLSDSRCLLACFTVIVLVSGMCVNPIRMGSACIDDNEVVESIKSVAATDGSALWVADNSQLGQACLLGGARSINSVNTYPTLDRWEALDPTLESASVYNRYAHISISLTRDASSFELTSEDAFTVHINVEDLEKTGATYFLSSKDLSQFDDDAVSFDVISSPSSAASIYKIEYKY